MLSIIPLVPSGKNCHGHSQKCHRYHFNLLWYQPQIVLTRENVAPEKGRVNFRFKEENPHSLTHILHVSVKFYVKFIESSQFFNVDFLEPKCPCSGHLWGISIFFEHRSRVKIAFSPENPPQF